MLRGRVEIVQDPRCRAAFLSGLERCSPAFGGQHLAAASAIVGSESWRVACSESRTAFGMARCIDEVTAEQRGPPCASD